ncbi:6-phosphogluconolactonase [Blochmannia endosymbiont of Camponotus sp. C-003]|uniref:6-phosphogluconolactonase n=1 Tax=unclassified Candidatus Blochmanniella TaxID=711328 RepID=UPI002025095F|nr:MULTISPECIES: 6-phosphogluconolactonase [unclassified Candidatus Blochmannia]URJ23472.1 6-phosphogluconolactonase [Blochmannia endosymbiont of Camponotus sp. C-003]URJ28944.1 6-phosphogluconolactonase [Blochmannia endosymbiont of Camponotus sp. C-046]
MNKRTMQIVYVASPESQQIYVWKLDNIRGVLELMQVMYTPGRVQPMAVHPNKRFLYVGIRPNFGIIIYRINQMGLLTEYGTIEIFSSPTHLVTDNTGTCLYCTSYRDHTVSVIPISMSGMLSCPVQIVGGLLGCHSSNIDKFKKLLWVPCLQEHAIRLFSINSCGMLTPYDPCTIKTNIGCGPRHMTFYSFDCYAYVINELASTVDVIKYDNVHNTPTIIQTLNIIPKNISINRCWASDIHITPDGRWLYCSDRAVNIISCLKISKNTKKIKFVGYQRTEEQPRGFAIDCQGKFLVAAGQKSNYISLYNIDLYNGKLTTLSRYSSGQGPMWVNVVTLHCE